MSIKKITIALVIIVTAIIGLQSCYKVATVLPKTDVEITGPVSFANNIIPVLNAKCNMSGCHSSGGVKPNLAADKAFNSITLGGYIDTDNPENSSLYLWVTGKKASLMPPTGDQNPDNINQYILAWIKQGAQNN